MKLHEIAALDIGLHERDQHDNRGKQLQKFFEADDLEIDGDTQGYPWCAAAVSYWVQQYLLQNGIRNVKPPRIAAVRLFPVWATAQRLAVKKSNPKPGDIVVFKDFETGEGFSHIGVVEKNLGDTVICIEGNTNDEGSREGFEVARRNRSLSACKTLITI